MNHIKWLPAFRRPALYVLVLCLFVSCTHHHQPFTQKDSTLVIDSVTRWTNDIARDVSAKGPVAWLDYFDDAPGFFMADEGSLVFRDYPGAKKFILDTLIKNIPSIKLQWANLRIDPLSRRIATIGSDFHETLTASDGKSLSVDGYFTGTARLTRRGWKLINLHWSTKKPGN